MHTKRYSQFIDLLSEEKGIVDALQATLEEERQALTQHDVAALESLATDKAEAFNRLEQLGALHLNRVIEAGFGSDKAGFEAFIAAAPAEMVESLTELWQSLRDALRHCQTQNQINGQIVHSSLGQARASLSLLTRGRTPRADVYTPNGTTAANSDSRSYAKV